METTKQDRPSVSFPDLNTAAAVKTAEDGNDTKPTSTGTMDDNHRGSPALLRRRRPSKFKNVANMVMQLQRHSLLEPLGLDPDASHSDRVASARSAAEPPPRHHPQQGQQQHRRYHSTTSYVVPYAKDDPKLSHNNNNIDNNNNNAETTMLSPRTANVPMLSSSYNNNRTTSHIMDHAQHLENLFSTAIPNDSIREEEEEEEEEWRYYQQQQPYYTSSHRSRVLSDNGNPAQRGHDVEEGSYQNQNEDTTPLVPPTTTTTSNAPLLPRRPPFVKRCWDGCVTIFEPREMVASIKTFLATTFCLFMVPGLAMAAILFYPLENPDLDFLPSNARLPWFLLFAVRQSVTFTLAQMTQWVLQVLTIRTTIFVRTAGPLVALVVLQSAGWPCLVSLWGCWNLVILHGDSLFVKHWLYWTGIRLFSIQHNFGDGILGSDLYGRILAAMIVLGVASAAKRTFVALYLSRRMLTYYRSQLEKVMSKVKLVVEVAELASRTEVPGFEDLIASAHKGQLAMETRKNRFVETVPTFQPEKKNSKTGTGTDAMGESFDESSDESDDDGGDGDITNNNSDNDEGEDSSTNMSDDPLQQVLDEIEIPTPTMKWNDLKQRAVNGRYAVSYGDENSTSGGSGKSKQNSRGSGARSSRGLGAIFPFLERWQEPDDMGRKATSVTLHDILQFKKAIAFMESDFPFSPSFGNAVSRKVCVKNAVKVYQRLLRFTPDRPLLPFDVIGALAYTEDGKLDEEHALDFLRVFLPDKDDTVSMLAWVQSIDNVYRELRFLRASLSNSSKIDSVLEDIFNVCFYAVLGLMALAVCGFNPWPLLVSFSTLTVSFAFAFGASVAKNVEGILMIAVRRPYDIGDRITIAGAEQVANPTNADTWLVEDISLTTTTLRFALTNEQATVNNASVANSRIVNHARSPRASVSIRICFSIDASQRQLDEFRRGLEKFLEDRPRIWVGLIHYRSERIDSDNGLVEYIYRAQHVKAWQDMAAIMINKGEWERYATSLATEMGIILDTPPRQMTVGLGLAPERDADQATDDRKRVAEFIRSISIACKTNAKDSSDKVDDAIAEYAGAEPLK